MISQRTCSRNLFTADIRISPRHQRHKFTKMPLEDFTIAVAAQALQPCLEDSPQFYSVNSKIEIHISSWQEERRLHLYLQARHLCRRRVRFKDCRLTVKFSKYLLDSYLSLDFNNHKESLQELCLVRKQVVP